MHDRVRFVVPISFIRWASNVDIEHMRLSDNRIVKFELNSWCLESNIRDFLCSNNIEYDFKRIEVDQIAENCGSIMMVPVIELDFFHAIKFKLMFPDFKQLES
jgi:hypothetical protein